VSGSLFDPDDPILTGETPVATAADVYLDPDEALWSDEPWSLPAMDQMYLRTHEAMFHQPPPPDPTGLRPREAWRCSSLGRCPRYQVLERAGFPKPPIDEGSRRRMDIGSDLHWIYGLKRARFGLLLGKEVAISDLEHNLTGHLDIIWGGPIQDIPPKWREFRNPEWIFFLEELRRQARERWGEAAPVTSDELKTVASYGFRLMDKDGRYDYRLQLSGYRLLGEWHPDLLPVREVERHQVVVFNRESGGVRAIPMQDWWMQETLERLDLLNTAWSSGNWPACTCGETPGIEWEAKLCAYKNPDGDGCCGVTLLDRLQASIEATGNGGHP
jgi:hypothetical protein